MDKNAGGTVTKTTVYYPAGGAMRVNGTLYYVLKDHLGSASVVTDASGNVVGEQRYYPFGETRLSAGTLYTDKLFTGQRNIAGLGIYHYQSRFYSPKLGRFLSADTIVPNPFNPQDFNRFAYVRNNPVRYTDPTGHICVQNGGGMDDEFGIPGNCNGGEKANYKNPFPGGVPAAKKPGKPKKDDGGGGGDPVVPVISLEPVVPSEPNVDDFLGMDQVSNLGCTVNACTIETPPGICPIDETCWMLPDDWNLDPELADYRTTTINAYFVVIQITEDRYSQSYVSFGGSTSMFGVSYDQGAIGSPFDDRIPNWQESRNFLTGLAINVTGSFFFGVGGTGSPGVFIENGLNTDSPPYSVEGGFYVTYPSISVTGTWGFPVP